ncbi:hypothetical protein PoB_001602400 [Plakobranchus ocellatus]|uniref:Uncharacterized protein n=1 Tax=Plakobranchus ocellatus TaxID=259542 RepID=A0AAV3Z2H0_9GAST|nr:hypothetical protein PoB_001602400 [Plakobranchus ocellatus]
MNRPFLRKMRIPGRFFGARVFICIGRRHVYVCSETSKGSFDFGRERNLNSCVPRRPITGLKEGRRSEKGEGWTIKKNEYFTFFNEKKKELNGLDKGGWVEGDKVEDDEGIKLKKMQGVTKTSTRSNLQQRDLKLLGPPPVQDASGGARTHDKRIPADLREVFAIHSATNTPIFTRSLFRQHLRSVIVAALAEIPEVVNIIATIITIIAVSSPDLQVVDARDSEQQADDNTFALVLYSTERWRRQSLPLASTVSSQCH